MAHLSIGQKYMVATSVSIASVRVLAIDHRYSPGSSHMKKLSMDSSYNVGPPSDVSWFKQSYWGL